MGGFYINPSNESKESFLKREGVVIPDNPKITWDSVPEGSLPVVVVNNGRFTAAVIASCERDLDDYTSPTDDRPRQILMVKIEKLLPVAGSSFRQYVEENRLLN